ncbi:MAG: adenine-specific methyltransferase EcoRI family protein [Bacteroidales bacterium]|nr:adenine-specific methyltransferase EcoRI family protein [Bacteroidales bacterium]
MVRRASNNLLHKAKASKSDEFYTLLEDINRELVHYKGLFRGKVVYCNCDNPRESNFFKYFFLNFKSLGLKSLIASYYVPSKPNLFSQSDAERGGYVVCTPSDVEKQISDLPIVFFKGDGDFRSDEALSLLRQADVVVTNPPFSLFREFLSQIIEFNKEFLVIANINAITYKEVFQLIQSNRIWLGVHLGRGISGFKVPGHYELYGTETRVSQCGDRIVSPNNCLWLTNLDVQTRHNLLTLTKVYEANEASYPKFDNYNAINVNRTQDIPMDYDGAMGVPITFLHKYNPSQFEIIQFRKGDDGKDLSVNGSCPYFRILIRKKFPIKRSHP